MKSTVRNKKRQAYYIAPLQPPTLAAFLPWEGSAGAGRVRPATANIAHELKLERRENDKNNYCNTSPGFSWHLRCVASTSSATKKAAWLRKIIEDQILN